MSRCRRLVLLLPLVGILAMLVSADAFAQRGRSPAPAAAAPQEPPPPPPGTSRGENFSAKPPAQLFASDCTGAGCHRGPQGLGKDRGQLGLASFLREHYTNSRESSSALAAYLLTVPGDARAARPEPAAPRTPRAAARQDEAPKPATEPPKPNPAAARAPPRGRQVTAAPQPVPPPAAAPEPPAPPPPPQFDIFD